MITSLTISAVVHLAGLVTAYLTPPYFLYGLKERGLCRSSAASVGDTSAWALHDLLGGIIYLTLLTAGSFPALVVSGTAVSSTNKLSSTVQASLGLGWGLSVSEMQ
jgi:hypothetical protein